MKCDICGKETFDNFPTCKFCVLESLKKKEGRFRPVTIEGEVERIRKKTAEDMADWLKKKFKKYKLYKDRCGEERIGHDSALWSFDVCKLIEEAKEKAKRGELK